MQQITERELMLPSDQDSTGRTLGDEEIAAVSEAIRSGTLTSTKGNFVKALEARFARKFGVKHAFACTSGTAAIHLAVAAINPNPGDEIVTTSITDMGALTPILYQGAIPVFAEVDPATCNVTAESIAACLSDRTKAIIVTHLFGNPCDMKPIMEFADSHGIPVIEDCAQAFSASVDGIFVGNIGAIGCFSLQQGKHITTGEGGMVTTNNDALARHMFLFINKAWGYGDANPDHYFLALNYRMSELQGAVALAQMDKLDLSVGNRIKTAQQLTHMLAGVPGIKTPHVLPGAVHTYWKYCLRVNKDVIEGGAVGLAGKLKLRGISCAPRYIQKPAFMCQVFQQQHTFGDSRWPFTLARPEVVAYQPEHFPQTFAALDQVLVLPWNENYTGEHVQYIAQSVLDSVADLRRE
jgi:dTDP-4-amino-4,6-dideoxygalactose transaminase